MLQRRRTCNRYSVHSAMRPLQVVLLRDVLWSRSRLFAIVWRQMELDCRVKAFLADQKCTVEIKGVAEECPFKADFRAHVGALLNITPEHVRPDDGPGTRGAAVLGFQSWARNRTRATLTLQSDAHSTGPELNCAAGRCGAEPPLRPRLPCR